MKRIAGMLIASATLVSSVPAAAQTTGSSGLHFDATGAITYDSNQLRALDPALGRPGRSHDDIRYSPALAARYSRATGRASLLASAIVGHDFFQNNSNLNRGHYGVSGSLGYSAGGRCSANATGSYTSRQNGISNNFNVDPLVPGPLDPPVDDVARITDNQQSFVSYGLSANCGAGGGRLTFGGAANHSSLRNGATSRRFANSDSDSYSANLGVGIFRPGQLSLNGSYSTISYPNRLFIPGFTPPFGLNSGVRTYRAGLSYSRPIGTKLSGTIGAAYLTARPRGGQAPYTAPAYNVGLTYRPGTRLSFGLSASRDVLASQTAGALFRVVDVANLTASYKLNQAISLSANTGIIRNAYRQAFAIPDQPIPRGTELTKSIGFGITYAPRPLYDVSLDISQRFRTSTPSVYNFESTRVGFVLAVHI